MQVERRQGLAYGVNLHAVELREQRLHRALDLEDDLGASRRHERYVPDKLNGVAEPLFGMEKNGLVLQGLFTAPWRAGEIAGVAACLVAAPSPLELWPSVRQ